MKAPIYHEYLMNAYGSENKREMRKVIEFDRKRGIFNKLYRPFKVPNTHIPYEITCDSFNSHYNVFKRKDEWVDTFECKRYLDVVDSLIAQGNFPNQWVSSRLLNTLTKDMPIAMDEAEILEDILSQKFFESSFLINFPLSQFYDNTISIASVICNQYTDYNEFKNALEKHDLKNQDEIAKRNHLLNMQNDFHFIGAIETFWNTHAENGELIGLEPLYVVFRKGAKGNLVRIFVSPKEIKAIGDDLILIITQLFAYYKLLPTNEYLVYSEHKTQSKGFSSVSKTEVIPNLIYPKPEFVIKRVSSDSAEEGTVHVLRKAHYRRGHYRRVPVGKREEGLRRLTWIRPSFVRGTNDIVSE